MLNFKIDPSHKSLDKESLRDAQNQAQRASSENVLLHEQVGKLTFIVESLWNILKEKHQLDDEVLRKMVEETQTRKKTSLEEPVNCKKCSRLVSPKSKMCVFCGEKVEHTEIFPY